MTTHHGKDALIKLGATGGSNTLIETTDWSIEESVDTVDDTAQGDSAKTHLVGMTSWTGSASANFDPGDTNGQNALAIGASFEGNFYSVGAGSGAKYKHGTATVTRRGIATSKDNKVTITFSFQGNGALADATVGA